MKKANAPKRYKTVLWVLFNLILLVLLGLGVYFFYFYPESRNRYLEGLRGFAYTNFFGLGITVLVFLVMGNIARIILKRHRQEKRWIRLLSVVICMVPVIGVGAFVLRDGLMDLPYLRFPKTILLTDMSIEAAGTPGARYYTLYGTDQDGNPQNFNMSKEMRDLLDEQAYASVAVLPHTHVVMGIAMSPSLGTQAIETMIPDTDLSDEWNSMQIQVGSSVYALGDPLSSLTEHGWKIEQTEYQATQNETLDAHRTLTLLLTNTKGQQVVVTVRNDTDETINTAEALITSMDFNEMDMGIYVVLPGKIALGWSDNTAVMEAYGETEEESAEESDPDEVQESPIVLNYSSDNGTLRLTFTPEGILDEIEMRLS